MTAQPLFITLADNAVQAQRPFVDVRYLEHHLKLACLATDHAVISAPYTWQSDLTYQACRSLQALLSEGILLFANRPLREITTFTDLLHARRRETRSLRAYVDELTGIDAGFHKEIPGPDAKPRCDWLDHCARPLYRTGSVAALFREYWAANLQETVENALYLTVPKSTNSLRALERRLFDACAPDADRYFSRAQCARRLARIQSASPETKHLLFRMLSHHYLRANADVTGSYLVDASGRTYPSLFSDMPDTEILHMSLPLLERVLSLFGLSPEVIDALSAREIIALKYAPEYRRFLLRYRELIQSIASEDMTPSLYAAVETALRHDQRVMKRVACARAVGRVCEDAFYAALSAVLGLPAALALAPSVDTRLLLAAASCPVGVAFSSLAFNSLASYFERNAEATPFYDFKVHVLKHAYHELSHHN